MTLNAAHGRSDGPNQIFLDKPAFNANLTRISDLMRKTDADIVGLQEVDGASRWSGRFDHAATMARQADYPWHYRGDHAKSWLYRYGTAVMSRLPVLSTHSHRFASSPPTPRKGFVISQIVLPASRGVTDMVIDVFSVHLDFLSRRTQARQLAALIETLQDRDNPAIVLGDFNSGWHSQNSIVRKLVRESDLTAYQPEALDLATYDDERLDWILISAEFAFLNYAVLPEVISDHQPVVAEIGINPDSEYFRQCHLRVRS
jgi:endonuclease/exonuclease/phosphatase family metal-dependent hydrolase